ncbi:MAG: hypothetical protein LC687_02200 [Actinobacteria bacterium]|nr:hypothetical protein [Actinomycetota bacterium]
MSPFWIGITVGFFTGGFAGIFLMSLMVIAGRSEDELPNFNYEEHA